MKVAIRITLDIDPAAWTLDYGVEGTAEIRKDVQAYSDNMITEHFRSMGVLVEKEN